MIDVVVKTLDSQNHRYSVPDDITVKQFKDRIAASVNIPPDKQRLIYCGRVLQDEKNLSEYNVHEKVIHLVMRAPPQPSSHARERRDTPAPSSGGGGTNFLLRATANQGPSSSAVRLQQAKTMLDKAAEVITQMEEATNRNSSEGAAASSSESPSTSPVGEEGENAAGSSKLKSTNGEPMEASTSKSSGLEKPSTSTSSAASSSSTSRNRSNDGESRGTNNGTSPAEELEVLYREMDALNNRDPPMVEGGQLMTSSMGNPLVGAISNSLQGGLFQAASAAFLSALSSINPSGSPPTTSTGTATTSSSSSASSSTATTSQSSRTTPNRKSTPSGATSSSTSSSSSQSTSTASTGPTNQPSTPSQPRDPSSGNHPLSGVRGITVRITNRGPQRPQGIRLEHPRCSVMVEVLDQYQEVQRRLQPFLQQYYRSMVDDRAYEGENDSRLQLDQFVLWRVSSALHYVSHALHAISDILIDLRRPPPRQLRARPFIVPQPAIVQAQINVAPNTEGPHPPTRVFMRSAPNGSGSANANGETASTTGSSTSTTASSTSSSATSANHSHPPRSFVNMSEYLDDDNEVVLMHVGPNDASQNPPTELTQNIMSFLSSQLGVRLGTPPSSTSNSSTSGPASSGTSPPSTPGVRRVAPVHNSQAAGNSGTNTTNATQTRVTPRAQQLHLTPLHVPGMGMTQFDPFLPCQSHHVRSASTRRRHFATNQTPSAQNNRSQDTEETSANESSTSQQQSSNEDPANASSNSENVVDFSLFANLLAEIMSRRNLDQRSQEEQQQDQMFAQLVRGVMSEVSGTIGSQGDSTRSSQQQTSLQEFLEPFSGGGFFTAGESDSIFAHLFNTISESLSMGDLIQLFFGDSGRLNQLFEPLQLFVRERILKGAEVSEANLDRAIDEILSDLDPHLLASAGNAVVHEGIDYVNTVRNFIRHRLHNIFNLILNNGEPNTFGSKLVSLLRHMLGEFVALSLYCFTDGVQGLERLVEGRVESIMSGMSPSIQVWSVNTSIMQLRSMMTNLAITDDHIRRYIVSPDEGRRMDEARQNRMSPVSPMPGPRPNGECASQKEQESKTKQPSPQPEKRSNEENSVEVMEVDELGGMEEVSTSESGEGAVSTDEPPIAITVGSQSWHSAVPQDWIPVITRDVERQRRGVPDTNLSDGYLCGVPLKRRKIATHNKPHGSVEQVLQDTLRQSLRSSGVNRNLVESVSGQVSTELSSSFSTHVRCALRDDLENNQDFVPDKFPKIEQKLRKK